MCESDNISKKGKSKSNNSPVMMVRVFAALLSCLASRCLRWALLIGGPLALCEKVVVCCLACSSPLRKRNFLMRTRGLLRVFLMVVVVVRLAVSLANCTNATGREELRPICEPEDERREELLCGLVLGSYP